MRRRNGKIVVGLGLVLLAVAAIMPVTAQAKPTSGKSDSDYPAWAAQIETPYWFSTSAGVTPDDRSLVRATSVDSTPTAVVNDGGRSVDFNAYTVTGLVSVLLFALGGGMVLGLLYSRRTKLSLA